MEPYYKHSICLLFQLLCCCKTKRWQAAGGEQRAASRVEPAAVASRKRQDSQRQHASSRPESHESRRQASEPASPASHPTKRDTGFFSKFCNFENFEKKFTVLGGMLPRVVHEHVHVRPSYFVLLLCIVLVS
eukprot:SAG31_NODE_253_length_19063_cov_31.913362_9_plen_132_part_00